MCGIAGAVVHRGADLDLARTSVEAMSGRMRRRGPDAHGIWCDPAGSAVLGHRRLSILDLDRRADQPMISRDGNLALVFNGEIYNFRELRADLEADGESFATQSDSEVLLRLYAREKEGMLGKLRGMFAFAIWDRVEGRAFIARDPYGIKPLYYATTPQGCLFASQVKALLETGLVSREPDARGQGAFWLLGSVPEPRTWFRDVRALPAGHFAYLRPDGVRESTCWSALGESWCRASGEDLPEEAVVSRVRDALGASVRAHLVADVPVAVLLSAGIDSSAVAALMREAGSRDLQAITLAFAEYEKSASDEAPMASAIARNHGLRHYVRKVGRDEFAADLPRILSAMDQPSVDGINTWYAAKAVAEAGAKVVVSGVGGDELFQGYSTFDRIPKLMSAWRLASAIPAARPIARRLSSWKASASGNARWLMLPDALGRLESAWLLGRGLFAPRDLPALMGADLAQEALAGFDPVELVRESTGPLPRDCRLALAQIESLMYLRNQLLRDADWASMDHSVELRTPLVDAWLLRDLVPVMAAFRRFPGKSLLRCAPRQPPGSEIARRAKTGFGIPVQQWLVEMGRAKDGEGMSRGWARELAQEIYANA
jgi:asparagine synthase (glutamine-hydrolysing)